MGVLMVDQKEAALLVRLLEHLVEDRLEHLEGLEVAAHHLLASGAVPEAVEPLEEVLGVEF